MKKKAAEILTRACTQEPDSASVPYWQHAATRATERAARALARQQHAAADNATAARLKDADPYAAAHAVTQSFLPKQTVAPKHAPEAGSRDDDQS
jgi:hypothetical protein